MKRKIERSLFDRYRRGRCSQKEQVLLETWLDQLEIHTPVDDLTMLRMLDRLDDRILGDKPVGIRGRRWQWVAVAICLLILGGVSAYWYRSENLEEGHPARLSEIEAPSRTNAVLILENQKEVDLDDVNVGDTVVAMHYRITRNKAGQLQYLRHPYSEMPIYNRIRTKTGGTAQLQLSDGTRVWLNVNSLLRYPVQFKGNMREVELRGEAYFEVAESKKNGSPIPFYVRGEKQTILVLGTKFNANFTASNETALLDGAVAFSNQGSRLGTADKGKYTVHITPNQVYNGQRIQKVTDINRYVDWKNGYFDLHELTVRELSEKLTSWYGVGFEVDPRLARMKLFGRVTRERKLIDVLNLLAQVCPMDYALVDRTIKLKYKER